MFDPFPINKSDPAFIFFASNISNVPAFVSSLDIPNNETAPPAVAYSTPSLFLGAIMITVASVGVMGNIMTALVFGCPRLVSPPPAPVVSLLSTTNTRGSISAGGTHPSAPNRTPSLAMITHKKSSTAAMIQHAGSSFCVTQSSSVSKLSSISILVTGLAAADAVLLSVSCPLFASSAFMTYSPTLSMMNAVSYMTVYVYPLASTFQTVSVWILSVITVERYVAVVHPFLGRIVCTPGRAMLALGLIFVISTLYNVPRFLEYTAYRLEAADDPSIYLVIAVPSLRRNAGYLKIYGHWMYFVFIFALPFTILVVFNGSVVRCVRLARKRRQTLSRQQTKEQGTAVMMVLVALVFLACNLLAFLLNALEVFGVSGAHRLQLPGDTSSETVRHSSTFYFLVDFNNLLVMTHGSLNFFIYYNFSQRFRLGCYRVWIRCACFRFCCERRLRTLASVAAVGDGTTGTASSYEAPHDHHGGAGGWSANHHGGSIRKKISAATAAAAASHTAKTSVASGITNHSTSAVTLVGNGDIAALDPAQEAACRLYLQRARAAGSTLL